MVNTTDKIQLNLGLPVHHTTTQKTIISISYTQWHLDRTVYRRFVGNHHLYQPRTPQPDVIKGDRCYYPHTQTVCYRSRKLQIWLIHYCQLVLEARQIATISYMLACLWSNPNLVGIVYGHRLHLLPEVEMDTVVKIRSDLVHSVYFLISRYYNSSHHCCRDEHYRLAS